MRRRPPRLGAAHRPGQPPGVLVVPLTADGQLVLVEQYRYTIDAWCLQVPAGGTHDADGRTLEEEIGATCGALQHLGAFQPSVARSNGKSHVYLARDVVLRHRPEPESREALALARSGRLADGQTALALLWCAPLLDDR